MSSSNTVNPEPQPARHSRKQIQHTTSTLPLHSSSNLRSDANQEAPDLTLPIYVGESAIAGLGVFTRHPVTTGERILRFDDSRHITPETPLRPELGELDDHVDHLANGVLVYMYEPERYLNHRCDPNAYCRHFNGVRYLIARRPIAAGEELVVDYALNSAVPGHTWQCGCGAHNCRGVGHLDFFQLPPAVQADYFVLLDDWFIDEHRARLTLLAEALNLPLLLPD
jgi:hypothetical protein